MSGRELFEALVKNTGLPEEFVRARFEKLLQQSGNCIDTLDMDQVREMLADLLLELINGSFNEEASELT